MTPFQLLPRAARPFVRFVIGSECESAHLLNGLFRFHDTLDDYPRYTAERREAIEELYDWFDEHLIVPAFREIVGTAHTASWLRSDAGHLRERLWELARLFNEVGLTVRVVWTDHPGPIVYYDEHQIVARQPVPGRQPVVELGI